MAACMRLSRSSSVMGFASPKGLLLDDGATGAATASTGRVLQVHVREQGGGRENEKRTRTAVARERGREGEGVCLGWRLSVGRWLPKEGRSP